MIYPIKIITEFAVKSRLETELRKYISENYKSEADFKVKKLQIKFLDLLGLNLKVKIGNIKLNEVAEIEKLDLSLPVMPFLFDKKLFITELLIEKPKLVYNHDFSLAVPEAKPEAKAKEEEKALVFVLNKLTIKKANLSLRNKVINKDYLLKDLDLELENLILEAKNNKVAKYSIKNNELDLSGTFKLNTETKDSSFNSKGKIQGIDLAKLLTVVSSKKQGVGGMLNLSNFKLESSGADADQISKNLVASGDLIVKDGSLYLLDYIVKTKKVVNSAIPIGKILNAFEMVTVDQVKSLTGTKYEKSLNSDDSRFSSLSSKLEIKDQKIKLNDLKIKTPIMKIQGSGYNSFDQKMSYKLEASLANVPLLPIIITGVKKVPIVLIDLHGLFL